MVKKYTDAQLLNKVKSLASFKNFPTDYWIIGVQSLEDVFNTFDDKFYLFKGQEFILMSTGTTNAGVNGLLKYNTYNPTGYAVIKTNEWYYDVWKYGLHRKKMRALRQAKPFLISRDGNKDKKVDEGVSLPVMCGINFHTNTYALSAPEIKEIIGGFSLGCQVLNDTEKYYKFIDLIQPQKIVTYCLIKEF